MERPCFAASMVACALLASPTPTSADGLTYLAHAPTQGSVHPPMIVLLHGSGADERDMITMWHDLPQTFVVVSPRAPFPHGGGFVWYRKTGSQPRVGDLAVSAKIIDLIVDEAAKRFDVDRSHIFVGGFSQGAVMTYRMALREPGRFRGAVVLSGSLSMPAALADLNAPSFFVAHGTADPRIPFSAATAARAALTQRGVSVAFHAYPGLAHGTNAAEMRDLSAWLDQQQAIGGQQSVPH